MDSATELIQSVENIEEIPGVEKKEGVIKAVKDLYFRINLNNPLLPEAIEKPLEKWLLDIVIPPFVDFIVEVFDQKKIFTHNL